jgi:tetratricopeptide (TPR) repeat protein
MKKIFILLVFIISLFGININLSDTVSDAQKKIGKGYYKDALKILKPALKKYPNNDTLLTLTGRVYKELNDYERALIYLRHALKQNHENLIAKKLIEEIEKTQYIIKNKILDSAKDWLADKGVDFLALFLGVLIGELLIRYFSFCQIQSHENYIRKYVCEVLNEVKYNRGIKKYFYKVIKPIFNYSLINLFVMFCCKMIDLLIILTISVAVVIIILLIEIYMNASYLIYIDSYGFKMHIFKLVGISFLIIFFIYFFINLMKRKKTKGKEEIYIADLLSQYLAEHKLHMLRKELKLLKKLEENNFQKVESIFENIILDDEKDILKKIYEKIKKKE